MLTSFNQTASKFCCRPWHPRPGICLLPSLALVPGIPCRDDGRGCFRRLGGNSLLPRHFGRECQDPWADIRSPLGQKSALPNRIDRIR